MAEFWEYVSVLGGVITEDSASHLTDRLAAISKDQIRAFADRLALVLHDSDTRAHASQPVRDRCEPVDAPPIPMSADAFLHLRCAVVAAGRATYEQVLADPSQLAGMWDAEEAEDLLFVAAAAWGRLTGENWEHETVVDFEIGSNQTGWS